MTTVTMPIDEYYEMKIRLSTLNLFLEDFIIKIKTVDDNDMFKSVMETWILQLKEKEALKEKETK